MHPCVDETDYMSPDRASVIAMLTLARTRRDEVTPRRRLGHGEAAAGGTEAITARHEE